MSITLSDEVWRIEIVNKHSTECTQIFTTRGCVGAITVIRTSPGLVPLPLEEDVISSPNISMPVSIASGSVSGVGGVGVLGPPNPSLGQFSVPLRQDFDQSRARGTPGFGNVHESVSRDVRNVAPSPSPSFNPTSLLFPLSDSGFASLPASVPPSSSPAFSLSLPPSSAPTFSSVAPSAPLPLFTLPSVVPSVLSLSSSSSAPSFHLQQFPHPFYLSTAPPSSYAPLPSFSALPLPSAPVRPPPGFSAPLLRSPLSGPLRGSPLSLLCLSLPFLLLRLLGILRTFRVLGLSAEYQTLGR